jgi:biotin-dependent carboxylase-like uncharacterized protein
MPGTQAIEIIKAGPLSTVQDLGRYGLRDRGVSVGGAMDAQALQLGNVLVGNTPDEAGIEITICPASIRFLCDTVIAVTGTDSDASLDGRPLRPWWRWQVKAGQVLKLNPPQHAMRTYLAVAGGINVEPILGSRGTDLKAAFGGLDGRALRDGDRLPLGVPGAAKAATKGIFPPDWWPAVRVLPGPQYDWFTAAAQTAFWSSEWQLTPQSNRMGYRLAGPVLEREVEGELPSHGVVPGVIQVPPSGQPIVLMADAQTTGGYPKIAVVIQADLWKLAQLRLGARLRFVICDVAEAREALRTSQRYLEQVKRALDAY